MFISSAIIVLSLFLVMVMVETSNDSNQWILGHGVSCQNICSAYNSMSECFPAALWSIHVTCIVCFSNKNNFLFRPLTLAAMNIVVSTAYDIDTKETQHLCSQMLLRSNGSLFTPFYDPVTGFCSYGPSASRCSISGENNIQYRRFCPCSIVGKIMRLQTTLLLSQ